MSFSAIFSDFRFLPNRCKGEIVKSLWLLVKTAFFASLSVDLGKQLAPQLPYTQSQTAPGESVWRHGMDDVGQGAGVDLTAVWQFQNIRLINYYLAITDWRSTAPACMA
jgi:hypothetical protein